MTVYKRNRALGTWWHNEEQRLLHGSGTSYKSACLSSATPPRHQRRVRTSFPLPPRSTAAQAGDCREAVRSLRTDCDNLDPEDTEADPGEPGEAAETWGPASEADLGREGTASVESCTLIDLQPLVAVLPFYCCCETHPLFCNNKELYKIFKISFSLPAARTVFCVFERLLPVAKAKVRVVGVGELLLIVVEC